MWLAGALVHSVSIAVSLQAESSVNTTGGSVMSPSAQRLKPLRAPDLTASSSRTSAILTSCPALLAAERDI